MLKRAGGPIEHGDWDRFADVTSRFSLVEAWRVLFRYRAVIVGSLAAALAVAILYLLVAKPVYTGQVQLLIETAKPRVFQLATPDTLATLDAPQIESQIALVKSERIVARAVEKLKLAEADVPPPSMLARFRQWVAGRLSWFTSSNNEPQSPKAIAEAKVRAAVQMIQGGLDVRRDGISYVLLISYNDNDRDKAVQTVNAVADAYIEDQVATRKDAVGRATSWLVERMDDLRIQMNAAALAAQQFKAKRDYRIQGTEAGGAQTGVKGEARQGKEEGSTLAELDSRAETYRKIYESYLQAYADSVQRQSYPEATARVITSANPDMRKSKPRTMLVLAAGGVIGLFTGLGLALVLHGIDNLLRTPRQVRDELGLECLGVVPIHEARRGLPAQFLIDALPFLARYLGQNTRNPAGYRLSEVADLPLSPFSRGVRDVRRAMDIAARSRRFQVLGVTSARPAEGKSTFTANLASLYAMQGSRVLLIDADAANTTLSSLLAPDRDNGLVEAISGSAPLSQCIIKRGDDRPDLLPVVIGRSRDHAAELMSGAKFPVLIAKLKETYDLVLVDMPPMQPVSETISIAAAMDAVVLAVRWAETPAPIVADAVDALRTAGIAPIGAVLTMAADPGSYPGTGY